MVGDLGDADVGAGAVGSRIRFSLRERVEDGRFSAFARPIMPISI
jgi:hypothetical protein